MKIIVALLIFSGVILIHELGHFLLARASHIVVTEFSLGMGPRLFSFVKGGTRYSPKLLPLGGSCAMLGEDMEDDGPGTFSSAPVWGRIATVAAGPVFNFLLALILGMVVAGMGGIRPAKIGYVAEDSAAAEAGLQEGDRILSYQGFHTDLAEEILIYQYLNDLPENTVLRLKIKRDGEVMDVEYTPDVIERYILGFYHNTTDPLVVDSVIEGMGLENAGLQRGDRVTAINGVRLDNIDDYNAYLTENPLTDEEVELTYERDGLSYTVNVVPTRSPYVTLGFGLGGYEKARGLDIVKYGFLECKYLVKATLMSLKALVTGQLGLESMSGPVGLVSTIATTYEESSKDGISYIILNMLSITVLLSANLGVMNLLPLPALDGGRLIFLFIEVIRRKPGNRTIEGYIHFAGLILLLAFSAVVMYSDFTKIF